MRLQSVNIKRFRSVKVSQLTDCGGFNVLIGKNNSGKSNLLAAIDSFFRCIEDGSVVALDPPTGQEIDFFNRQTDAPIEITLSFSLSSEERDTLAQSIIDEAPQMQNAAENIGTLPWLHATVKITPPPRTFGFVSDLTISSDATPQRGHASSQRTILGVGLQASFELYGRASNSRRQEKGAEALSSLDMSELRMYMDRPEGVGRPPLDYFLRRLTADPIDTRLAQSVERILDTASSFEEATREIRTLATGLREEARSAYERPLENRVSTFAGEEDAVPNYVRSLLLSLSEMTVLYLRDRRRLIGQEEAKRLLDLKVRRGGPEILRGIQETVEALMGVQIDAFRSDQPPTRAYRVRGESDAELDVDNFLVQVNGSGIREGLRLVLDYELQRPSILLVEEPEMHLHPALETAMMRYLKRISSDCQVFVTTHSTNFLDTADMKNVYLISKSDSTHVQLLEVGEAEAQIPRELGIRLSSLFMFDRLVFVEGSSDEDVLREWASTMGVNFSQANVGFISMGGVRNLTHFAAEKTLSFLTKRQVHIWFLMDRDETDEEEIERIQSRLGDKAVAKFLSKREIENYLVLARPIVDLIEQKKQANPDDYLDDIPLTDEEVNKAVERYAEELKQVAIDKRVAKALCNPVYPDRKRLFENGEGTISDRVNNELSKMVTRIEEMKNQTNEVAAEQTEVVANLWKENNLAVVPGDLLLDAVFRQYGFRFRKERDSVRLAALMYESEISQEIKDIIREIGE